MTENTEIGALKTVKRPRTVMEGVTEQPEVVEHPDRPGEVAKQLEQLAEQQKEAAEQLEGVRVTQRLIPLENNQEGKRSSRDGRRGRLYWRPENPLRT